MRTIAKTNTTSRAGDKSSSKLIEARLRTARIAHLATADREGHPHVIPVCFVYDGHVFYTPVDLKPKRTLALVRVRNIQTNPAVAVLIDQYDEDWSRLWHILVRGSAILLARSQDRERSEALQLLRGKYVQYREGLLPKGSPVIRIRPERITTWGLG